MNKQFGYTFPAIRGVQAGREFYVSMCPLRLLPKLFLFDEVELVPELRAQRQLNKVRLPEIARYIVENDESYTFSAITASIDADVEFVQASGLDDIGSLYVPMSARFIINDGQHRRAAIEMALRERPELADETIAVVFFLDRGLSRCQQMFADLNRYAIRPSPSLSMLYDHRDEYAQLSRYVVNELPGLRPLVEMERSSLSKGSRALLTLSAMGNANRALLQHSAGERVDQPSEAIALAFWDALFRFLPDWRDVRAGERTASAVRKRSIHSHAVMLHALGRVGNAALVDHGRDVAWSERLAGLSEIDWDRDASHWQGRAVTGGNVNKSYKNVALTTGYIKERLGLPLTPEEDRAEFTSSADKAEGKRNAA